MPSELEREREEARTLLDGMMLAHRAYLRRQARREGLRKAFRRIIPGFWIRG